MAFIAVLLLCLASQGLTQEASTTDPLTDAIQEAIQELVGNAPALADAILCNYVTNTLSEFKDRGEITTDPVLELSVDESSTLGLFEVFPVPGGSALPVPLDSVTFDCSSKTLTVASRPYGRKTIIPGVMELDRVAFSFTVDLPDVDSLVISFSGEWNIHDTSLGVHVTYTLETRQLDFAATPSSVRLNLVSLANDLTGLQIPNPFGNAFTFDSLALSGTIFSDGMVTMILKLTSQANHKVYIIYQKPSGGAALRAVAVDFSGFRFSSLISEVTGIDVSGVPYFGTLGVEGMGLTISTGNLTGLPTDIFADSDLLDMLTSSGEMIASGTCAVLKFDFLKNPIKLTIEGSLKFTPLIGSISVNSLLSAIPGVDFDSIPVPFDLSIIRNIDIVSFSLDDIAERSICIEVGYNDGLRFFNNLIEINDAMINLCLSRQPVQVRVEVSGEMRVGSTTLSVELSLDENDDYVIKATADTLPISNAISQFQASVFPPELSSLLSNIPFVSFSMHNPRLIYPLSSVPQQIQIGGTPAVSGYRIVSADVLILREQSGTSLIEGFDIGTVNLAELLRSVSGFNFGTLGLLNQDIEVAILLSPKTLPNVHLHGERLQDFAILKGISVQAEMSFPSDCSEDDFCAVAQSLLGADARLSIRGTMESANEFTLFAGVTDISVGDGLIIREAGLQVEAGTQPTMGLIGSIELPNPPIILTSEIFLSTSGVVLRVSQTGCWDSAFGVDWLSICSILGSIAIAPGLPISRLEVGGEIKLGDPSCSTPINAIGFLGIDAITPTNNYYYVQFVGETTMSSFLSALCVDIDLPRPLGESGFPEGFLSSFSLAGHDLPHAGISIPAGFRVNGTLNILGLEGSADITIGLPTGIDFRVALPPIDVGNGLLRMSESASSTSHGPFLRINIALLPSPNLDIEASGYVQVLGISAESSLRITSTHYEFSISGNMLDLFEADLMLSASYGSLSQTSFRVKGSFRNNLYDQLESRIKQVLQDSANIATSNIQSAQDEVNRRQGDFDSAVSSLQSARGAVDSANSEFDSAENALRGARDHVNNVCSERSCGSSCVPCPTCCDCCGHAWGRCVCWRPGVNHCCRRVTDPTCLAANAACRGLKATAQAALRAAEGTVNTAQQSLTVAQGALRAAEEVVDTARVSLDVANAALEAASATYKVGTEVAGRIASVGINGLISIREISFDVELSVANGGAFSGSVRANFLGQAEVTVSLSINLRDIASMASQLANEIGDGFSSLF